jgi:hypothetical protein
LLYFVARDQHYRDKKVVGVFVRFVHRFQRVSHVEVLQLGGAPTDLAWLGRCLSGFEIVKTFVFSIWVINRPVP